MDLPKKFVEAVILRQKAKAAEKVIKEKVAQAEKVILPFLTKNNLEKLRIAPEGLPPGVLAWQVTKTKGREPSRKISEQLLMVNAGLSSEQIESCAEYGKPGKPGVLVTVVTDKTDKEISRWAGPQVKAKEKRIRKEEAETEAPPLVIG